MYLYHADSVGNYGECAEPYGNKVVVVNIIYRPHNKGDDYYPFEPHNVLGINIPGKHTCGYYRYPGYGVKGYGGNSKRGLNGNKGDFYRGGALPSGNNNVSCNAYKACNGTAYAAQKQMGKGVERKLQGLHYNIFVFIFYKANKHHYGAAHKRNNISPKNGHFLFLRSFFFFNLPDAVTGGNNGKGIECRRNKVKMNGIVNKPHTNGDDHHFFEFDDIFAVDNPGEKRSGKNGQPGYGVKGYCSKRKNNRKNNKKKFKRNRGFAFKENKVSDDAYNRCDNTAHAAKKIVRNSHKSKLHALRRKNFIFVFDKADKHHHGAGNYGNYVGDNNRNIIQNQYLHEINKKLSGFVKAGQYNICKQHTLL